MNSGKIGADGTGGRDGTDKGSIRGPRGPKNAVGESLKKEEKEVGGKGISWKKKLFCEAHTKAVHYSMQ